jgi:hypothetical protein
VLGVCVRGRSDRCARVGGLNEESRICTRLHVAAVVGGPRIKRNVSGEAAKFFRIVEKRGSCDNMSSAVAAGIAGRGGGTEICGLAMERDLNRGRHQVQGPGNITIGARITMEAVNNAIATLGNVREILRSNGITPLSYENWQLLLKGWKYFTLVCRESTQGRTHVPLEQHC